MNRLIINKLLTLTKINYLQSSMAYKMSTAFINYLQSSMAYKMSTAFINYLQSSMAYRMSSLYQLLTIKYGLQMSTVYINYTMYLQTM